MAFMTFASSYELYIIENKLLNENLAKKQNTDIIIFFDYIYIYIEKNAIAWEILILNLDYLTCYSLTRLCNLWLLCNLQFGTTSNNVILYKITQTRFIHFHKL